MLDSAKGWAGAVRRNGRLWAQFAAFRARPDTFSLGVCNGAQLMALLGWVPGGALGDLPDGRQPRFVHNASGRFESRWATVRVEESPSVLLKARAVARDSCQHQAAGGAFVWRHRGRKALHPMCERHRRRQCKCAANAPVCCA